MIELICSLGTHFFSASKMATRFVSDQVSKLYAKYRVSHTEEFFKYIVQHLRKRLSPPNTLAVDVGCGTGSSTRPLAPYFDRVVGCDISETQVAEASKDSSNPANVSFSVAPCDNLPAADGTVDLVTVSEAIHWFLPLGIDKFYTEVDRVLKPNGCLAVYEYSRPEYVNHPNAAEMNQASRELWADERIMQYTAEVQKRTKGLAMITTPYSEVLRDSSFEIRRHVTLEEAVGEYWARSSFYLYYRDHPEKPGPIEDYTEKLKRYLGDKKDSELFVNLRYQVWLVMGRKPEAKENA